MSKILILADIHANIRAFEAVLEATSNHSLDAIYCAGDIVGYGSYPNECIDMLRQLDATCIRGNHERFVLGIDDGESFNPMAYESGTWTKEVLTEQNMEYLSSLSDELRLDDGTIITHGAPGDPDRYLFGSWELQEAAALVESAEGPGICVVGHTHTASISNSEQTVFPDTLMMPLATDKRVLINPGSVGSPRYSSDRVCFSVVDLNSSDIFFSSFTLIPN
jgi:predicted phosphodiesterase